MALQAGTVLQERYRIVSLLGRGGMGSVYRAWDTRLNAPVALKEMTPQPGLDPDTLMRLRAQFRQEAEVLARLSHPNLVDVMDFYEEEGNAYLVMKFIEGVSLARLIAREGRLPEPQVLTWAKQLIDALAYCHSRGILHRDLKPHNVIVTPEGQAVLVDFGLVKLWDPNDPHTQTVMRGAGTPEYAPPEQYSPEEGHTDPRSDVYGLGATLYHALTGQAPLSSHVRIADPDRFRTPRELNPEVSEQVNSAVVRAMALSRNDRAQDTGELRSDLFGEEAAASPPAPAEGRTRVVPEAAERAPTRVAKARPAKGLRVPEWFWGVGCVGLLLVVILVGVAIGAAMGWSAIFGGATPTVSPSETAKASKAVEATETPLASAVPATPAPSPFPTGAPVTMPALPVFSGMTVLQPAVAITPDNAGEIKELAIWGGGAPRRVTWSPDGKLFIAASSVGVWIHDAGSLEVLSFVETDYDVLSVAVAPDSATLATGGGSFRGVAQLWRISDASLLHTLEIERGAVTGLAFSSDGTMLAAGTTTYDSGEVHLWQVSNGASLGTLEGHLNGVTSVAFSPDEQIVASSGLDGTVRLWQISDRSVLHKLAGGGGQVAGIDFSSDGTMLAAVSEDGSVQLWQVSSGVLLSTLEGRQEIGTSVAFAPGDAAIASGSESGDVWVWQLPDGEVLHMLKGHTNAVFGAEFSADGGVLASSSLDGTVRLWNTIEGEALYTFNWYLGAVTTALVSDGAELAVAIGDWDGTVELLQTTDGTPVRRLSEHDGAVAFSPDGTAMAVKTTYRAIQVWHLPEDRLLSTVESELYIGDLAVSPEGEYLAVGGADVVEVWRVSDGVLLHQLEVGGDYLRHMTFSLDGTLLATAPDDGTVQLWRVSDGALLHKMEGHEYPANAAAFSADGEILASASTDDTVRLWQVSTGAQLRVLEAEYSSLYSVAFSPAGSVVAAGADDGVIHMWRVSDGKPLGELAGHTDEILALTFTADGMYLVSGSPDGSVRLWGVVEE
jgi:WD40 repeat protein